MAVLVATGQAEHPLAQQVPQCVLDLPRVAPVWQIGRHILGQRQPLIQGFEQEGPPSVLACSASKRATTGFIF